MANQFINPQEEKVEDTAEARRSKEKKLDLIAEKAAQKAAKTEQKDEEGSPIFSE
jgi:hypothetical protein